MFNNMEVCNGQGMEGKTHPHNYMRNASRRSDAGRKVYSDENLAAASYLPGSLFWCRLRRASGVRGAHRAWSDF